MPDFDILVVDGGLDFLVIAFSVLDLGGHFPKAMPAVEDISK